MRIYVIGSCYPDGTGGDFEWANSRDKAVELMTEAAANELWRQADFLFRLAVVELPDEYPVSRVRRYLVHNEHLWKPPTNKVESVEFQEQAIAEAMPGALEARREAGYDEPDNFDVGQF